jgi:parallel beta-helix repeat protein
MQRGKLSQLIGIPLIAIFVVVGMLAVAPAAQAATITVCTSGCDHTTIQAAINAASAGDTINVAAGTYAGNLEVNKSNLTLKSTTLHAAIIQTQAGFNAGSGYGGITVLADGVTIDGFKIEQGVAQAVIHTHNANTVTIINNWIVGLGGANPRGIDVGYSVANSNAVLIKDNTFNDLYCGVYINQATNLTIDDNHFEGMGVGGGAVVFDGTWPFSNVDVKNNSATGANYLLYFFGTSGVVTSANNDPLINTQLLNTGIIHNATQGTFAATIQAAINAASAGDTINVAAGTYAEEINLNKQVTINGANAGIFAGANPGVRGAETIINGGFIVSASGAKIDGVTIQNGRSSGGVKVGVAVATSGVTIEDTIIENVSTPAQSDGISTQGGNNNLTLTNSTIRNNWRGIYLNPGSGHVLTGNLIDANNGVGVGIGSDGQSNLTLTGNTISNHGLEGWGSSAVGANVVASGNTFTGNGVSVAHYGGSAINAASNYWGTVTPAGVAASVSGAVTYMPWCNADFSICTFYLPVHNVTQDTYYFTIQPAVNAANNGDVIQVAAGTYDEDVNINKSLSLIGASAASTTIRGVIGGDGATVRVAASNVTVAGFTLTRLGNNTTDWNDTGLNSAGVAIQGAPTGMTIRDNILTGNRTGIDINNSSGHTIRNNAITFNRTGLLFRNQTDNMTVVENEITDNWTVGVLFLDASSGSNSPVQTALNSSFSNNDISGNWYGQVVDRQSGGSLPTPGTTNLKNFSGNWLGTITPVVSIANSAEPGYAAQIPVAYGGSAVPPGGQPDILGPASANIDFTPYLSTGTDTNVETTPSRGTYGFQGDFSNLWVDDDSPQTGAIPRIQEGVNLVTASIVNVAAGTYTENVLANKSVELRGAQYGVAIGGRTAGGASESTIQGLVTVAASNVSIDGFTLTNPSQPYAVNVTSSSNTIAIGHNFVDNVGGPSYGSNVHAIVVSQGPDSVTISDNSFTNISANAKSANGVGVIDSASSNPSTGLVVTNNTFASISSATRGAYGIIINNAAGAPGAQILNNTFSGLSGGWTHAVGLEGPTPNAIVTGNVFSGLTATGSDKSAVFFEKNSSGGTVTVQCNQFNDSTFYGVAIHPNDLPGGSNGYNYVVTAEDNWWNAASGPYNPITNPVGTGALAGPNVDFEPWLLTNSNCTSGTGNWLNTTTNVYNDLQDSLNAALPGETIQAVGVEPLLGGATANQPGVIIDLNGKTAGPGSPFLTVNAADIIVNGPGVLDGNGSADPAIRVTPAGDNFILNGVEIREWATGVHVDGAVDGDIESLKIVNNWIHTNSGVGLQVDKQVSGVVTIQGNLFKVNGGDGVSYGGAGTLNATLNSWGDDAGPGGPNGDSVGANVDYDPWTFAEVYLDVDPLTGGDQIVRGVNESTSFDVDLNVDGENLYGVSFRFTYDPNYLTFNGPPTFVAPWAGNCSVFGPPLSGTFAYTCYLTSGSAWDGGTVATFNFTANGPSLTGDGPWTTTYDISHLTADTNAGAVGGVKVFVNNAGYNAPSTGDRDITDAVDGTIDITGIAQFTGFVDVQGRPNDSGALVQVYNQSATSGATLLASGTSASSGKYTTSYVGLNLLTIDTTYYFQVDRALYLPTTVKYPSLAASWAQSKSLATRPLTSLATFVLLGGDATDDDKVDLDDATCIGNQYGLPAAACSVNPLTSSSDVNGDGATNILDLVLFGGNYFLSASPWTP